MAKNIGIFGGTFNPPHNGHIKAVECFKKALNLGIVYVIPSGIPPHKSLGENISGADRYNMSALAFCDIEGIFVSDYEIKKEGKSYSSVTVQHFKEQNPFDSLFLFTGTDMFLTLHNWYEPQVIFDNCTVGVLARYDGERELLSKQSEYLKRQFNAKIRIIPFPPIEISSSFIREQLKEGRDVKELLPESVLLYIKQKGLYLK